jgi:hypothetical protein
MRPLAVRAVSPAFGLLVLVGLGLALAMEAGVDVAPVLRWLTHLPLALRLIIYAIIGVPVALGMTLYGVLQIAEFLHVVSRPFVWLRKLLRRL